MLSNSTIVNSGCIVINSVGNDTSYTGDLRHSKASSCAARTDVAAAFGVLNTGGNVGGIIAQPIMGFLTNGGAWGSAFISGTVFAWVAAALWLVIDPERRAELE